MFLLEFLAGFFLGLIADWYLREPITGLLARLTRRMRRAWTQPHAPHSDSDTVLLGKKDTHVCIIGGEGILDYAMHRIICRLDGHALEIPGFLRGRVKQIEEAEQQKQKRGEPYAWNGRMAHVERFNDTRTPNDEERQLELSIHIGQYFHFMATLAALHEDFKQNGFNSDLRRELIGDFYNWRFATPPNVLNGLPVNLHIITDDSKFVFSRRSSNVAIAANEIAAAINENIHPDHDYLGTGNRLDFEMFVRRALAQEIGWFESEHSGTRDDPRADVRILLFTIDTARVAYGLLGYVSLPLSFAELHEQFKQNCGDRFEISALIEVDLTLDSVCQFIHQNRLYNSVGLGAVYTLVHRGKSLKHIQTRLTRLQSDT